MQLEHTLFSIGIIQIKPQLEKVLNLPANSLTKEIQLTQDILRLLIDYQIPTDLLSYSNNHNNNNNNHNTEEEENEVEQQQRVIVVKENVRKIIEFVKEMKKEEIQEKKIEQTYQPPPPSPPPPLPPAPTIPKFPPTVLQTSSGGSSYVYFLGVARIDLSTTSDNNNNNSNSIIVASFSYNADVDISGIKLALNQVHRNMLRGRHYSVKIRSSNEQFVWHMIIG
jgi:hypothetical protein